MRIISLIKQVPDAEARIRATAEGVDLDGVTFVIDGMDEYGVEQALRIREGGAEVEDIAVLSLGPKRFEEAIRTALAMGADRAIHLETEQAIDVISQAKILADTIQAEGADIVFVGGKEADWDSAALGAAVAEALGWAHADWVTGLELADGQAKVTHDSDNGSQSLTLPLPAVITTQQGLNEPRYPTLPNIMKAKRKPLEKHNLDEQAVKTVVIKQEIQSKERLNTLFTGDTAAQDLVNALKNEAKVL